jgi:hypothetical protein
MSFLKNLFGTAPKENKPPPYAKIAEIVLRFSVAVAGESEQIAENAALTKIKDATREALLITEMPPDQMAVVYYIIRVSRLLEVGKDIDRFIVHYVNNKLIDRSFELQDEIGKCLI